MHQPWSLELVTKCRIKWIFLSQDNTWENIIASWWENQRQLSIEPWPHPDKYAVLFGWFFLYLKTPKLSHHATIPELFFCIIIWSIAGKRKFPNSMKCITRNQREIGWQYKCSIKRCDRFFCYFGNSDTISMSKFWCTDEIICNTRNRLCKGSPRYTLPQAISLELEMQEGKIRETVPNKEQKNAPWTESKRWIQKNYQYKTCKKKYPRSRPNTTNYTPQKKEEKREEKNFHGSQKKENLSDIIIMRAMRRRHTISALLWYRDQESEDRKQLSKYVRDIPWEHRYQQTQYQS